MDSYLNTLHAAATESEAVQVIQRLLEDESIYHFGRVLDSPKARELATSEQPNAYWSLLELFSFGTLSDYKAASTQLPELTERQLEKLKHLSLVSLASVSKVLPYDDLIRELDCAHEQQMEDLVIDTIYKGLLSAKLDQQRRLVEVEFVVGRDVRRGDLQAIYDSLDKWSAVCEKELNTLTVGVNTAEQELVSKRAKEREFTFALQDLHMEHASSGGEPESLARYDSQYTSSEYQNEERRTGASDF
ncbi:COP9 signalosome complex subunit 7b [Coemansia pectinata]|uniref:COP9 signalosome complex subunit 7b n=1 Tax=Coemansia pectinata TaxID=1052879 RepID=A0A9W8GUG1_9FUNG|nr:COP9 signalosome complex subunit 7b [Coemansia pectinata]